MAHPSKLDNKETSVLPDDFESYGSCRRLPHIAEFSMAWSVYDHMDDDKHRSKADQLSDCRSNAWFSRHEETGEIRVVANACHLRWCPVCSESRRNYIGHSVSAWLQELKYPKLMSLTLKHRDIPLLIQINNLYRYFLKLRKYPDFKKIVTGGVWFFQIKLSKNDGLWHPHIHCVVDGLYMPRTLLRHMWQEITVDSTIVDIRSVKDPEGCALEVARYAAKPGPLKDLDLDHAVDLVYTMHGRRICGTWGSGRKISLLPPKFTDKASWKSIGSWSQVMTNRKTNRTCEQIYHAWRNHEPLSKDVNLHDHEARAAGRHVFVTDDSAVLEAIYSADWNPP